MMNDNDSHGMAASLQGSIQAITETAEIHKRRATLAERQLMESGEQLRTALRRLDAIRRLATGSQGLWASSVLQILDGKV